MCWLRFVKKRERKKRNSFRHLIVVTLFFPFCISAISTSDFCSCCCLPTYYLPSYLPTFLPTYLPTFLPTYLLTYLRTYIRTYLPTYLLTYLLTSLTPHHRTFFNVNYFRLYLISVARFGDKFATLAEFSYALAIF